MSKRVKKLPPIKLSLEERSAIGKQNRGHGNGNAPSVSSSLWISHDHMHERAIKLRASYEKVAKAKEREMLESTSLGDLIK
jgi:hypothetical protein